MKRETACRRLSSLHTWGALRGSNPQPPVPQTSALPIELRAPYVPACGGRVSRVLFVTIISLGPKTGCSSRRQLLSTSGLGEQPDNGRFGDCCGEDCPFHSQHHRFPGNVGLVSVALALARANLDCRRRNVSPAFTGHPCSVQLGLSSSRSQRSPFPPYAELLMYRRWSNPPPMTKKNGAEGEI
jgi:hypothetical protein